MQELIMKALSRLAVLTAPMSKRQGRIIRLVVTVAAAAAGWWIGGGWPFAVMAAAFGFVATGFYLSWAKYHKIRAFAAILPELLLSIANLLKANYSLAQAIDHLAQRLTGMSGDEMRGAAEQMAAGARPQQAIAKLGARYPSDEMDFFLTSLSIHETIGGDIAATLESAASTISETLAMREEVNALTSQARISSYVVCCFPPAFVIGMNYFIPTFYNPLLRTWLGNILLASIFILVLFAFMAVRQIQLSLEEV